MTACTMSEPISSCPTSDSMYGLRLAAKRTGKVVTVYPRSDGLVRAVDVEFPTGVLRRGSHNLALLEESSLISEPVAEKSSGENGAAKSGTKD